MSCITLQLSRAASVAGLVVRLRLRVMFTTTTLEEMAIDSPINAEPARLTPSR